MKVIVDLTEAEKKGIKEYLKDTGSGEPVTYEDVKAHIRNIVSGYLSAPHNAESDYIAKYQDHDS